MLPLYYLLLGFASVTKLSLFFTIKQQEVPQNGEQYFQYSETLNQLITFFLILKDLRNWVKKLHLSARAVEGKGVHDENLWLEMEDMSVLCHRTGPSFGNLRAWERSDNKVIPCAVVISMKRV